MLVKVVDRNRTPIPGATIQYFLDNTPLGSCETNRTGTGNIEISPKRGSAKIKALRIVVKVGSLRKERVVDPDSGAFVFIFQELDEPMTANLLQFLTRHFSGVTGIAFLLLAVSLAFLPSTTAFQQRIILAVVALAGAGIATELTGFLNVKLSFGKKLAIQAGGALAVFIVLYLLVPAQ